MLLLQAFTFAGCTGPDAPKDAPPIVLPDVEVEAIEGFQDASDWLFNPYMVHELELTVDEGALADLRADPDTYVLADATFDGEELPDVGLRLKGMYGSFRSLDEKAGFKLDLNDFVEGRRFHGVEKLTLNNSVVDCSYTKEHLGYHVYRAAGVAASRAGYAWVTLNGEPYGLYVLAETPDDRFLSDHFEDASGRLYDGKYLWFEDGSYKLLDLRPELAELYQLEEGEDAGFADLIDVTERLADAAGQPDFYERMGEVLDWPAIHTQIAVAQYIGHVDGYSMNTNNYRLYFDPGAGGRALIVPWDLDYAFIEARDWGKNWKRPQGVLTDACWDDPTCAAAQADAMAELLETVIDDRELEDLLDDNWDVIEDYARDDPRRECSTSNMGSYRAHLRNWIEDRPRDLENFWDL